MIPGDGQDQVIAPIVAITPDWNNALPSGQTTVFTVTVTNPDIGPYENVPLTVETGPEMVLTGASGAPCSSCPPDSSQWTLLANVGAGGTVSPTVNAMMLGSDVYGIVNVDITASMANSGLVSAPQPPAWAQYSLDRGSPAVDFVLRADRAYAKPGQVQIGIATDLERSIVARCVSKVEVNTGSRWFSLCQLGDCNQITRSLPELASQTWQMRVRSANGRVTAPVTMTMVADDVAPTAEIVTTGVLTGSVALIRGTAMDTFPTTLPPTKVRVSIDGGRYHPAILSEEPDEPLSDAIRGASTMESSTKWLLPLRLWSYDVESAQFVARAVDKAGNVGPDSAAVSLVLDGRGPVITATQTGDMLGGKVTDGSGVASLEVSLDGGVHYEPIALANGSWSFDLASWPSWPLMDFANLRAADLWGNASYVMAPIDIGETRLHLPLLMRSWRHDGPTNARGPRRLAPPGPYRRGSSE